MKTFFFFLFLILPTSFVSVYAMDDRQITEARDRYLAAVNGSRNQVKKAIKHFEKMQVSAPYNSLIKAYRGSLESVMATRVYMPWSKMKYVDLGSEKMDDVLDDMTEIHDVTSIKGTSLSLYIKSSIAQTYYRYPRYLNRYQDAKDILNEILESPQFLNSNLIFINTIYTFAAQMAENDDDKEKQTDFLSKIQW